jgi:hypothetical protein
VDRGVPPCDESEADVQLTPFRWLLIAVIIGGGGAIAAAPTLAITDGANPRRANMETKTSIDLSRRSLRAATTVNRASADWMRELASPVAAQTKLGAPVIPSRAALDVGAATPDTIAWTRLTAVRDSIQALRARFAPGSLGDVGVAIANFGPPQRGMPQFNAFAVLPERLNGTRCVVVASTSVLRSYAHRGNAFGPCFWYGAFGLPGRGAREWLNQTQHRGTGQTSGAARAAYDAKRSVAPAFAALPRYVAENVMLSGSSLQLAMCVARGGDICGRIETDPTLGRWSQFGGSLGDRYGLVAFYSSFGIDLNRGPGDFYSEFGADRFVKLWRSPLPFPQAFEEATGQSLNAYMRRAAIRDFGGEYRPGPRLDGSTMLLLVFAVTILLGLTFLSRARPIAL